MTEAIAVLGIDLNRNEERYFFRDFVDRKLIEFGFYREGNTFEEEDEFLYASYTGFRGQRIDATFIADDIDKIMKYDYFGDEELVDPRISHEHEDLADIGLTFYGLSNLMVDYISKEFNFDK